MIETIIVLAAYCICIAFAAGVVVVAANVIVVIGGLLVIAWKLIKSYMDR